MYWMLMRPAIGWGAFLLVHAIGIPLVYSLGKAVARDQVDRISEAGAGNEEMYEQHSATEAVFTEK
jgi:hypothetical protein